MAYSYYPYQPNYFAPQYQQPQQQTNQNGFVRVQSENEARMYPVAPGNSVTFIDETGPYCYVKTMDISQLDRPKFEKYRLVKEDQVKDTPIYVTREEVEAMLEERFSKANKTVKVKEKTDD